MLVGALAATAFAGGFAIQANYDWAGGSALQGNYDWADGSSAVDNWDWAAPAADDSGALTGAAASIDG